MTDMRTTCRSYLDGGLSIIPCGNDKRPIATYLPDGKWKCYQETPVTHDVLDSWLSRGMPAVAIVCGDVSGGVEIIDFDVEGYYERWCELVGDIAQMLPTQRTGGGGYQVAYRCDEVTGSLKLAWHPNPDKVTGREIAIETRGNGGCALLPPSIHPAGGTYETIIGDFADIPRIAPETRNELLGAARDLCQAPKTRQQIEREKEQPTARSTRAMQSANGESVSDAYNAAHDIVDTIISYGYRHVSGLRYCHPDGSSGSVALLEGKTYNHSTNDPMCSELNGKPQPRSSFDYFCHFEHNGDYKSATREAAIELGMGYEAQVPPFVVPDEPPPWVGTSTNGLHKTAPSVVVPVEDEAEQRRIFFLSQGADDEGNALCVHYLYKDVYNFCPIYGWMENTGTHWEASEEAEAKLNQAITNTLIERRTMGAQAQYEAIVSQTKPTAARKKAVKSNYQDKVTVSSKSFDSCKDVLNCKNGVVDLKTGEIRPLTSSDRFSYCVDAEYDPNIPYSEWTDFLSTVVGDYSDISNWLQMAVGYSITGRTSEEIMFYMYGPTRSGKGTFTTAILNLLGFPLGHGVDFSMFTRKRDGDSQNFDLAPLRPARFISASESGKYQTLNEAAVKTITGGDPIRASFKGKDHFSYTPSFKIWLSSNHPARGDVSDDAFWGRVKVIIFPNSHLGNEDKGLKSRMQTSEYKNALLAWAIDGAVMWYNSEDGLVTPDAVKIATQGQRDEADDIQQWLDECVVKSPDAFTKNKEARASYESWCDDNGFDMPKKARSFKQALTNKGFINGSKNVPGFGTHRGWIGLGLLLT